MTTALILMIGSSALLFVLLSTFKSFVDVAFRKGGK